MRPDYRKFTDAGTDYACDTEAPACNGPAPEQTWDHLTKGEV